MSVEEYLMGRDGKDKREAKEVVMEFYAKNAKRYDDLLATNNDQGPFIISSKLAEIFPDQSARARLRVLEVGAGTGLVGSALANHGYGTLEALEPSKGMLEILLKKKECIYDTIHCAFFGLSEQDSQAQSNGDMKEDSKEENGQAVLLPSRRPSNFPVGLFLGTYDVVVFAFVFVVDHVKPAAALMDVARVLRPGGYFLNVVRVTGSTEALNKTEVEPKMDEMEERGIWSRVCREDVAFENPNDTVGGGGVIKYILHVYQKC